MSEAPAELWLRPTARRHWYQAQHEPPEPDAVRYVRADVYEEVMARNVYLEKTYAALLNQMREAAE